MPPDTLSAPATPQNSFLEKYGNFYPIDLGLPLCETLAEIAIADTNGVVPALRDLQLILGREAAFAELLLHLNERGGNWVASIVAEGELPVTVPGRIARAGCKLLVVALDAPAQTDAYAVFLAAVRRAKIRLFLTADLDGPELTDTHYDTIFNALPRHGAERWIDTAAPAEANEAFGRFTRRVDRYAFRKVIIDQNV